MTQHYTREAGYDGGIYTGSGDAPGVNLSDLLDRGLPPLRAALEIGAAIADIISISEEDGSSHGDIKPSFVVVAKDGSVSVEGYGAERKRTRAPEPAPAGIPTDIYGLGVVMHALLSNSPLGSLSKDAETHDSAVVKKAQAVDLHSVADKAWSSELRMYLATILAYDITERPEAADIANVMGNAADDTPGEDLAGWAKRTVNAAGGGKSASKLRQGKAEDLSGPMTGIDESISPAIVVPATNDAQSTAAWNKDRIAAMVAEQEEETVAELPEIEPETMEGPEIEQMGPPAVEHMDPPADIVAEPEEPVQKIQAPRTVISAKTIETPSFAPEPSQASTVKKKATKTVIGGPTVTSPTISGPSITGSQPPPPPPRGPKKKINKKLLAGVAAALVVAAGVALLLIPGGDSSSDSADLTNTTHELVKSGRYHLYIDAPDSITPTDNMGIAWQLRSEGTFAVQVVPNDDRPMSVHRSNQTSQNVDELEFIIDDENTILTKQVSFEETSYQLYVISRLQTESGETQVLCESLDSNSREKFNLDQMYVMLNSCQSLRTERDGAPSTEETPDQEQGAENYDSGIIPDNDQDNSEEPTAVEQAPQDQIDEAPTQAAPAIAPTPTPNTTRPAQPPVERRPQRQAVIPEPEPEPEPEPVVTQAPAPAALAPPPYHATITVAGGTANLRCGDGQSPEIPGTQTLTFSSQQSCAIVIGDAMGAITVDHTGSWTCALSGDYVICSE